MKIKTFVFAVLMCFSTFAIAEHESTPQTPTPETIDPKIFEDMFRLPTFIDCGTPEVVMKMLVDYEEIPIAQGQTFTIRPDLQLQPGPFTLFVNPETGSFSFVVQFKPADFGPIWCITQAGSNFGPTAKRTSI